MVNPNEPAEPEAREPRTAESIAEQFPDAGPPPDNQVHVDPDAEPSPNIEHPE